MLHGHSQHVITAAGIVFVGGFSYADVLESAKGWAGTIRYNSGLWASFQAFYTRPDTWYIITWSLCARVRLHLATWPCIYIRTPSPISGTCMRVNAPAVAALLGGVLDSFYHWQQVTGRVQWVPADGAAGMGARHRRRRPRRPTAAEQTAAALPAQRLWTVRVLSNTSSIATSNALLDIEFLIMLLLPCLSGFRV